MAANEDSIDAAKARGYLSETPRERQVRVVLERDQIERSRSDVQTARQMRAVAKCNLIGHRDYAVDENTNECLRCGRLEDA